jgi:multisubunit Na+/H+ antiporter MnhB subunit
MPLTLPKSLLRRVFLGFMALTALGIAVALAFTVVSGWVPPRESATVVLLLYFAVLLLVLSAAFIFSGDTLMHHHTTGTIQRATSPVEFWSVVGVQVVLAVVLFVVAAFKWRALYGPAV